jgi:hypothetical protein
MEAREKRLEEALQKCQRALAMLTSPAAIHGSTVINAWSRCVEAEAEARALLAAFNKGKSNAG